MIDRTCALTRCEYEWGVHVTFFAERARLSGEQVRATVRMNRRMRPAGREAERVLIEAVDALHHHCDLEQNGVRRVEAPLWG